MPTSSIAKESTDRQFTLQSLLWTTTAVACLLAYANRLGGNAISLGIAYAIFAIVTGSLVGFASRNLKDAMFWSCLTTLLVYLAVAGGRLPNAAVGYGWGMVGSACGAINGIRFPKAIWLGTVFSAVVGLSGLAACIRWLGQSLDSSVAFDLACALIVAAMLRPSIQYLQWFETRSRQPRFVLAAWLTLSIVVGNLLVPILAGVER
jgi:hypothetical protein